jgi:hypothetical protein
MRYSIEVKQKHIDKGRRGSTVDCPIALAVRERLGIRAEVYGCKIVLKKPKPLTIADYMQCGVGNQGQGRSGGMFGPPVSYNEFSFTLPYGAVSKAGSFDTGNGMEPFSFDLEIPPEIL